MQVRAGLVLPVAAFLLAVLAPAASGATRIGQTNLATSHLTNEPCATAACTYIQYTDNGATPSYVSPVSGVITQWQLASGSAGNAVTLRALRPGVTSGAFSGLGTGVPRKTQAGLNNFVGERLPIQAGESIGLDDAQGLFMGQGLAGAVVKWWSPALVEASGPSAPTNTSVAGHAIQLNADVEPDADGDRYGDRTQDGCPGDATRQALPCPVGPTNPILPVVTQLRASPKSIRFGQRSSITFRISKVARWTLRFEQARKGRVRRGRCRLQTRSVRTGRRCTHYTSRGTVSGDGGPGRVTLVFQGALGNGRALPSGPYRVTATARDAIGTSKPVRTSMTLKPKLRR
jgi:hypothetical protein